MSARDELNAALDRAVAAEAENLRLRLILNWCRPYLRTYDLRDELDKKIRQRAEAET